MHDEFRVHATLPGDRVHELVHALEALDPVDELRSELGRMAVTHGDGEVFVYMDSLAAARAARSQVKQAMAQAAIEGEVVAQRWHPAEERWEDAGAPLPSDTQALEVERARRDADQDRDSSEYGQPEWEVRITLPSREEAHELADRLEAEGIPVARRWHHLLIGAADEDQARELSERLRAEAPAGAKLEAEGSGRYYWDLLNAKPGPFSLFSAFPH